jgi:hypothetical protein
MDRNDVDLGAVESAATDMRSNMALPADDSAERAFWMGFEGLGDNCEFGIVQRTFGAETLGLLRWATMEPNRLISMLENGFDGVGDLDNTHVWVNPRGEYNAADRRYFSMHTFILSHATPMEKVLPQMARRLRFLKDKLIGDLQAAEKIFVYKRSDGLLDATTAAAIFRAMRGYGPIRLLCVRKPAPGTDDRTVEQLEDGLFMGYISALNRDPLQVHGYVADWAEVCHRAADLANGVTTGRGPYAGAIPKIG